MMKMLAIVGCLTCSILAQAAPGLPPGQAGAEASFDPTPVVIREAPIDPYDSNRAFALPRNLRRVGAFYFSAQPYPHEQVEKDEWLTLKYFYGIRTDANLRPVLEAVDQNESGFLGGYYTHLKRLWSEEVLPDPRQLYPFSRPLPLSVTTEHAVLDGSPLDQSPFPKKWDFRLAELMLERFVAPGACPVLTHCRAGVGRTGQAQVLVSYAIFGVPMPEAIRQMLASGGKPNELQYAFLRAFAERHEPGYLWSRLPVDCLIE